MVVSLLAYCTAAREYGWYREIIDVTSGESVGYCNSIGGTSDWSFYVVNFLLLLPMFHAGRVAYKTLGMDEMYSESKGVLVYILLQIQVRSCRNEIRL